MHGEETLLTHGDRVGGVEQMCNMFGRALKVELVYSASGARVRLTGKGR